jgi:hypothetical protein
VIRLNITAKVVTPKIGKELQYNIDMIQIDTISISELIDLLKDYSDLHGEDCRVAFSSDYGDRARTQQVVTIHGDIEEETIYKSAYSDSGWAVDRNGYHEDEDGTDKILIIK